MFTKGKYEEKSGTTEAGGGSRVCPDIRIRRFQLKVGSDL